MARTSSHRWLRLWALGCGTIVVALVGAALVTDGGVARHERLAEELRRLEVLNLELEEDNRQLRTEIEALEHDPRFVERVIRDELGWVRDDEVIFIVPEREQPETEAASDDLEEQRDG